MTAPHPHKEKRAIRPRGPVEQELSEAEIIRYREGCKLRRQLDRILTPFAVSELAHQINIVGANLDEVVAFALNSWLHHSADHRRRAEENFDAFGSRKR